MSRLVAVTVRSLCLFLGLAGLAAAQEPPPLEPPSLEPPRAGASDARQPDTGPKPAGPKPAPPARPNAARPATPEPEARPMLAIPGVTAPAGTALNRLSPAHHGADTTGDIPLLALARRLAAPVGILTRPGRLPAPAGFPLAEPLSPPSLDALPPRSGSVRTSKAVERGRDDPTRGTGGTPPGDTIPLTIEPIDERPDERSEPVGRSSRGSLDRRTVGHPAIWTARSPTRSRPALVRRPAAGPASWAASSDRPRRPCRPRAMIPRTRDRLQAQVRRRDRIGAGPRRHRPAPDRAADPRDARR